MANYYPKCTSQTSNIVDALVSVGERDVSFSHRKQIAKANGIDNYMCEPRQNTRLLSLLFQGKLIKE